MDINELYDLMVDTIYSEVSVLNIDEFHKYKDELIYFKGYLPCLIRRLINPKYYSYIYELKDNNSIYERIYNSREYSRKEIVLEFLEWCKDYGYVNLIDEKFEDELDKRLSSINREFDYLKERL